MAIDYTGYSSLPVHLAQVRLSHIRESLGPYVLNALLLAPAKELGPFDKEIAQEFGFEATCRFGIFVQDKSRLDLVPPTIELVYQVFGTENVLVLWGSDMIKPASRAHPGYNFDTQGVRK